MRLSVFHFAWVLGALAFPVTAMQGEAMSQEAMPLGQPARSVLVNHEAATAAALPHHHAGGHHAGAYHPAMAGGAYCPPGAMGHGMHHGHHGQPGAHLVPGYAMQGHGNHPHYGQMTYPPQHAPAAWPYIGPYYPNPQIPPGWKKVSLEWDDGYWYLDFKSKKKAKHH